MKKVLCCLLALVLCISSYAEKKVGQYHSSYFNQDYDIEATYTSRDVLSIYIAVSGEYSYSEVFLNLQGDDIPVFIDKMQLIKQKFLEWKKVAEDNNVTDLRKEFDILLPRVTVCWNGSQWWFAYNHRLSPRFIVLDDGRCICAMMGEVSASSNEYIDAKYYFVLSSESDFDEFLKSISPERIEKVLTADKNKADLFK